ncbi:MAG: DUF1549 and DUF1553 domain-containing protein [bacterium]|nr:DUF1549 and DUF1553 domain-containing protein [bacterium]
MKTLLQSLTLIVAVASVGRAEDLPEETVDFRNDLIPMFTKHGCNAGACHGAAIGRGGFKLSLYGGDPQSDFEAVVRQINGRRVNLSNPEESLILLKPAEYVEHGGGAVIDDEGDSAQLLIDWIKQGAGNRTRRDLSSVEITPRKRVAKSLGEPVTLRAVAHYSDGTSRDVTRWTIFSAEDPSAVDVDPESAVSKVLRRGRHIVVARYLSEVVPIELVVQLTDANVDLSDEPRNNFIDDEILESLATLGITPSPPCDDATYLRRVYLDLTGRLPSAERVNEFLEDSRTDKRKVLVDELLQVEEFNEYWTLQLAKLLRIRPQQDDTEGAMIYHQWVAEQIENDVSYKQIARALIMATGDTHEFGPANFYRTDTGQREQAEFASELFMGSRLRCANCHNHPLDRWTQDDYHGLAAIFAKVERGRVVGEKPNGQTIHPRTLEPAIQRIPGEQFLAENATDGRRQLANWLTDASNPYFAKAIVNRLWKRMVGRGLVEPVDDFRDTNPATHPALLDKLAEDFAANGYSLRHTLRLIANSTTYARSADAIVENKDDDRFYSHAARRPLEAEVLSDAISDVLGISAKYGSEPEGTRAVMLVNPKTRSTALDVLGRCGREESCENTPGAGGGLPQKLHLLNGALLNARIAAEGSRLNEMFSAGKLPKEIVDAFYLTALNRPPSAREREHWERQLAELKSNDAQRAFLEDFVWGLMTCEEFVTNH